MKKKSGDEDSRAKSDEGAVDVLLWIEGLNDVVGLLKKKTPSALWPRLKANPNISLAFGPISANGGVRIEHADATDY